MRATAHIQIVPERRRDGRVTKLKLQNLTQGPPASPEPGAAVVRLEVDVDPAVFTIPTAYVEISGDPAELTASVVPFPVPDPPAEGEGETETFECPVCGNPRDVDDEYGPDSMGHQACDEAEVASDNAEDGDGDT